MTSGGRHCETLMYTNTKKLKSFFSLFLYCYYPSNFWWLTWPWINMCKVWMLPFASNEKDRWLGLAWSCLISTIILAKSCLHLSSSPTQSKMESEVGGWNEGVEQVLDVSGDLWMMVVFWLTLEQDSSVIMVSLSSKIGNKGVVIGWSFLAYV